MALLELDRNLLHRCLNHEPRSWEEFVDRFLGLVYHVVNHSARSKSIQLSDEDREDLCADVFVTILNDDFAVLRAFRGASSLATYLTVIARRVVVREMLRHYVHRVPLKAAAEPLAKGEAPERLAIAREEVERLLEGLDDREAQVVRMFHMEGRSYREISERVGIPENSIGPTLSRVRARLREAADS